MSLSELIEDPYAFQKHLGFRIVDWSQDYCRLELPFQTYLTNRYGILHGGIHATLLDTAMGFAGCFTGDAQNKQLAMTLSLNVNYLGQMKGGTLVAEGFRTGGGARTFFARGEVGDELGNLVSTGTGVFRYRGKS